MKNVKKNLVERSPFQIYYGQKSNQLVKTLLNCVDSDNNKEEQSFTTRSLKIE